MLHPDDIARLCQRKYAAYLRSVVEGSPFFPLEVRFGRPSTTEEWDTLRREIAALTSGNLGYRIEWSETNTRRWGKQRFPERVWFENEQAYLRALRKGGEVDRFRANLTLTREECPELAAWLLAYPTRVVEFADAWPDLLRVCRYFLTHPRPGVYAREVPASRDTKFIEGHAGVLRSLLDAILPESARAEAERFEERFGLRYDEPLVRFRFLDPDLRLRLGFRVDDLAAPLSQFRSLDLGTVIVLITENKMTFLTLPAASQAIGVWGGGGAAELLTTVSWLGRCRLFYWGDLDVHGFHILSRLRRAFPSIVSLMMDQATLDQFEGLAVPGRDASYEEISGLKPEEEAVYRRLGSRRLLLEQERIPHAYAVRAINRVLINFHELKMVDGIHRMIIPGSDSERPNE